MSAESRFVPGERRTRPRRRGDGRVYENSADQYFHAARDREPLPQEQLVTLAQTASRGRVAEALLGLIRPGETQVTFETPSGGIQKKEGTDDEVQDKRRVKHDAPVAYGIAQEVLTTVGLADVITVVVGKPLTRDKINEHVTIEVYNPATNAKTEVSLKDGITDAELEQRREVVALGKNQEIPADRQGQIVRQLTSYVEQGEEARETFIDYNVKLIPYFMKINGLADPEFAEDLISIGNTGLIRSVELYDWRRGYAFSTYAEHTILQRMRRGLHGLRGESYYKGNLLVTIQRAEHELRRELAEAGEKRTPTIAEVAERAGLTEDNVIQITEEMRQIRTMRSLDEPVHEGEKTTIIDLVGTTHEDGYDRVTQREDVKRIFDAADLTDKERKVFVLKALDEMTNEEITRECGLSKSGIVYVYRRALGKLRQAATKQENGYFG